MDVEIEPGNLPDIGKAVQGLTQVAGSMQVSCKKAGEAMVQLAKAARIYEQDYFWHPRNRIIFLAIRDTWTLKLPEHGGR